MCLTTTEWILLGTTLFLGVTALFVPFISEWIKRGLFAPKLKIEFSFAPPYCHKTTWKPTNDPVYYFRFMVKNEGKSQARHCEVVLEELWTMDASGIYQQEKNFSPVNLRWVGLAEQFININPKRRLFCDIGHLSHPNFQANQRSPDFQLSGGQDPEDLKFFFDLQIFFFSQMGYLTKGNHKIKICVYSENAKQICKEFFIFWTGTWKDKEPEQFRELVISTK